jgi:hypothetical protein
MVYCLGVEAVGAQGRYKRVGMAFWRKGCWDERVVGKETVVVKLV